MTFGLPSINEIVKGQVYVGNLSAALSLEQKKKLGITHIVSVCSEYPSTGPSHLTIAVNDTEYDNLLIHLPEACQFIQAALDQGGKVLVHCVMGVSRSTTVVAAYLMKTRKMNRSAAIRFVKQRRPQTHPNYGFLRQLEAFSDCHYEPSPANPVYAKWKRQQEQNVTNFLNRMIDTTSIIPDQLFLSSDFPDDPGQAESLLLDLGITHLMSLSPAQVSSAISTSSTIHRHIDISIQKEALLVALPSACDFIRDGIESGGQVLVHCPVESRACTVVCAYLMSTQQLPSSKAYAVLEDALPLFNPTRNFSRHLELFEACGCKPTSEHPLVREWMMSEKASSGSLGSAGGANIGATAADVLSETSIDMHAFGEVLAAIQKAGVFHGPTIQGRI